MNNELQLSSDDVVTSWGLSTFVGKETFKYSEFQQEFRKWVSSKGNNSHKLLSDGIPCEFITTTGKD